MNAYVLPGLRLKAQAGRSRGASLFAWHGGSDTLAVVTKKRCGSEAGGTPCPSGSGSLCLAPLPLPTPRTRLGGTTPPPAHGACHAAGITKMSRLSRLPRLQAGPVQV